jgi:hypothetical protein
MMEELRPDWMAHGLPGELNMLLPMTSELARRIEQNDMDYSIWKNAACLSRCFWRQFVGNSAALKRRNLWLRSY